MTPKEEAEKNWAIYDRLAGIEDSNPSSISYASREAYKAALRREIEKRIPESPDTFDEYVIGTRAAMKTILELLDTVEP